MEFEIEMRKTNRIPNLFVTFKNIGSVTVRPLPRGFRASRSTDGWWLVHIYIATACTSGTSGKPRNVPLKVCIAYISCELLLYFSSNLLYYRFFLALFFVSMNMKFETSAEIQIQ